MDKDQERSTPAHADRRPGVTGHAAGRTAHTAGSTTDSAAGAAPRTGAAGPGSTTTFSIQRRDLLQGLAWTAAPAWLAGAAVQAGAAAAAEAPVDPATYPPARTGLRGAHPGAFEVAHQMRDGTLTYTAQPLDEHYDLVVVGGGISGLAAAFVYRQKHPQARVLILDNHDDFGGHAKRNEFHLDGGLHLMNGGTYSIESPRPYSPVAERLMQDIGIDSARLAKRIQRESFYPSQGMDEGYFFDRENFGRDVLVTHRRKVPWGKTLASFPISAKARADLARLEGDGIDYLPGLSSDEKKDRLSRISYRDYLVDIAKVDPDVVRVLQARTHGLFCLGIEAVAAIDCWGLGLPGFKGLKLARGAIPRMGPTAAGFHETGGSVDVHLPDGGATVARSLVRALNPAAIPGQHVEDLVTARADYAVLDRPDNAVNIRLNSTVVRVERLRAQGGEKAERVRVDYVVRDGAAHSIVAPRCVLACYSAVMPYLCPELPDAQKQAMKDLVKSPLVYVSVAIRSWAPFRKLGVSRIYAPAAYYSSVWLNEAVTIGGYSTPHRPGRPVLVHLARMPCAPGKPAVDQFRIGRAELLATSFETFETHIRSQLDAMLGPAGFDSTRDILAITVNRWPHGYAYEYDPLTGPPEAPGAEPYVVARQRFGPIAIANSDVGGQAYMDAAINQAHRAVTELLADDAA